MSPQVSNPSKEAPSGMTRDLTLNSPDKECSPAAIAAAAAAIVGPGAGVVIAAAHAIHLAVVPAHVLAALAAPAITAAAIIVVDLHAGRPQCVYAEVVHPPCISPDDSR